jgi:hypothetical protein
MARTSFIKYLTSSLLNLGAILIVVISGTGAMFALIFGDISTALIGGAIAIIAFFYASYRKNQDDGWA